MMLVLLLMLNLLGLLLCMLSGLLRLLLLDCLLRMSPLHGGHMLL